MSDALAQPVIGNDFAALIRRRVSIIVSSRDAARTPHLMRAVGCRLAPDRRELTLFLDRRGGRQVIEDVAANGQVAVVFSEPSTHQSVQVKGRDARTEVPRPGDHALVEHYIECFADEIAPLGYPRELVVALFAHRPEDLVAIRFTPGEAYDQTPGAHAASPVPAAAR